MKTIRNVILLFVLLAAVTPRCFANYGDVLFSDDFETNSASRWIIFSGANGGPTNDYSVSFSYNYSNQVFGTASQTPIPAAPHSPAGQFKGVKVTANKNRAANPRIAAVSLYPVGMVFSNNYSLRFDMFMDYVGDGAGGGTGSTEMSTFGVNHLGNKVNWWSSSSTLGTWPSDGQWFWVTGENGTGASSATANGNHHAFKGNTASGNALTVATALLYNPGQIYNTPDNPLSLILPVPPGESWGAPGKQWVEVEVRYQGGYVTWLMNGFVMGSHNETTDYPQGTIMIGYADPLSGVPSPVLTENYTIYDNLKVVDLGTNTSFPTITLVASNPNATKPGSDSSQYGTFTISRTDASGTPVSDNTPLTVKYTITGSASNGVDFVAIPGTVTIPAGQSSTNLLIKPTTVIGDPTTTVTLRLAGGYNYELRSTYQDTVTISDPRGVPAINVQPIKPVAYERYRSGAFNLYSAASFAGDVTLNIAITGTATNGINYTNIPSTVILPAGQTNVLVAVNPIDNNIVSSNSTVILTVNPGTAYRVGPTSNAIVTLRNDDLALASVLFSDNLDTDSSANWNVNKSESSDIVTFAYDYSADGIPSSPATTNGTTLGAKLQVNVSANARAGMSLSPKGGNFTGDYRLRFDFWLNYNGDGTLGLTADGGADSTLWFGAGVGTTGDHPVWDATNSVRDAIWFDADTDGSSTVATDLEAYQGSTFLGNVWVGGSQSIHHAYYGEFGGEQAPALQQANYPLSQFGTTPHGLLGFRWHDMIVEKKGSNVTWMVDGLPFAIVPTNGITLSTNVLITCYDPSATLNNDNGTLYFALIDNVRVESLAAAQPPQAPNITSVAKSGNNIVINFTGGAGDSAASFTLVGASALSTNSVSYTAVSGANITGSNGSFQATAPMSGATMFYRIKR